MRWPWKTIADLRARLEEVVTERDSLAVRLNSANFRCQENLNTGRQFEADVHRLQAQLATATKERDAAREELASFKQGRLAGFWDSMLSACAKIESAGEDAASLIDFLRSRGDAVEPQPAPAEEPKCPDCDGSGWQENGAIGPDPCDTCNPEGKPGGGGDE